MTRPPLPPAARIPDEPPHTTPHAVIAVHEYHTLPGWVGALIYLACTAVLGWAIIDRMLPGTFG